MIARLAEAEVAVHGHSPAWISWSGSINAPDEGIDIHVQVPVDTLRTGFLERPDIIFQAKKHSMTKGAITKEMVTNGEISATISEQAAKGAGYIIVSLGDDCSPPMKMERLKAMREAVRDDPNSSNIYLDFYDRSKLAQWLRQHPSVMLWVKGKLGQGYSGWQPYGAWSNPPRGADDTLISAPGVTITLPSGEGRKFSIENAIEPMRNLIRSTTKAVRITGLSGVGKTRIVQALFDERVGKDAIDRTIAVYVDTGNEPDPSASAMLGRFISEGRRAVMILDNCPSELHSGLARKISASGNEVSLITIEYDIRDDKPQTTEVIHIEAVGPEVAELLLRRFPRIGQNNARRIAEFGDGNARVSLAIAERVEEGESLAQLTDAQLFDRLFEQRKRPDDDLREQAEILSLVYSFSVSNTDSGYSELEVLGSISGYSHAQLFRSAKKLMDRHVIQKRGHWRAILPHAIANKLAISALDSTPVDQLKTTFEASGHQRLLMSFAHRLGLLHDHPVAKEIVIAWLQPGGLLSIISVLDDMALRMLVYVAPVAPEELLDKIEAEFTFSGFEGMGSPYNSRRRTILDLVQTLAYEKSAFERCTRLLIRVADHEDESNNYDAVRNKITRFFQAYLSGTHATLDQRIAIMNECLASDMAERRSLGFRMLSTALDGPPWTGSGMNEFGARPRDFGFQPNHDELVEWRSAFIDVAVRLGTSGDSNLEGPARLTLANAFRGIWRQKDMREKLIDAARRLHAHQAWSEGWKAVRATIYFDYSRRKCKDVSKTLPAKLAVLDRELEPRDLIPKIMTYVLSMGHHDWALCHDFDHDDPKKYREAEKKLSANALRLGEDFAASGYEIDELAHNLFSNDWMPYRAEFGRGLAKGGHDFRVGWQKLINQLKKKPEDHKNFAVFCGFIEEADAVYPARAQELLDQCALTPELRHVLVDLHPRREFTETGLDRCMALLDDPDIDPWMYGQILWRDEYANFAEGRILDLAQRLISKPNGDDVVLDALSMKLHGTDGDVDTLGADLRRVGLRAAILRLQRDRSDLRGVSDHFMECVVGAALRFDGNEAEKLEWLDTIFAIIDEQYGCIHSFEDAIATTIALMPKAFLNRFFECTEDQKNRRMFFIRNGSLRQYPLAKIDMEVLIEWCQERNDDSVWALLASGISLWSEDEGQGDAIIPEAAVRFLESAPEPETVIEAFADRVRPSSWSGSLASVMQPRADAICRLFEHESAEIAVAAKSVSIKLAQWIEYEKVREQREDEEREQRFE